MFLPPASRTTMSGRCGPSAVLTLTCSSKSHRALIPASSTTRRSCISPHRPRASGRRKAVTRDWVWARSWSELCRAMWTCSASAACERCRAASDSRSCVSTLARVSFSGSTRCSTAAWRLSSSPAAVALAAAQPALGDFQEPPRAQVQRLRRQRLEPLGQLPVDQRGPLAARCARPAPPVPPRPLARSSAARAWPVRSAVAAASRPWRAGSRSRPRGRCPGRSPASSEIAFISGHARSRARQFPA